MIALAIRFRTTLGPGDNFRVLASCSREVLAGINVAPLPVFPPIRESFFRSLSEATPVTRDAMTNGTAMSWRLLMKMVPKGWIQSAVNSPHPAAAATIP